MTTAPCPTHGTLGGALFVLLPALACAGADPDATPAGYPKPDVLVDTAMACWPPNGTRRRSAL